MTSKLYQSFTKPQKAYLSDMVKRINQQYVDIAKRLGTNSSQAKLYESLFQQFSNYTDQTRSKSGYMKVAKPSQFTEGDLELLARLNRLDTYGQYRQRVTNELLNQGKTEHLEVDKNGRLVVSNQYLIEYSANSQMVHNIIVNNKEQLYKSSSKLTRAVRRSSNLTIDEMNELIELYQSNWKKLPDQEAKLQQLDQMTKDQQKDVVNDYLNNLFNKR